MFQVDAAILALLLAVWSVGGLLALFVGLRGDNLRQRLGAHPAAGFVWLLLSGFGVLSAIGLAALISSGALLP